MMKACTAVARIFAVSVLMAFVGSAVAQQAYPSKPSRVIVPWGLGGIADILARLVSQKLSESWGQQFIVDNRPGGNTVIGFEALVKSPPDGYTIMVMAVDCVIVPNLFPVPYDILNDFAPVATIASSEYLLVLHPSVPVNNLQEFIALAKSKPGQLNYASSGSGGASHLAAEMFSVMAGVKMQHIAYKGGGPAIADLIGGHVQLQFSPPISSFPHLKSGKLKAIAIGGETRSLALPQVPTFAEAGLPGFDVKIWLGVLAPAGTPKPIIDKLAAEVVNTLGMPDIREKLASQGVAPFISTPNQFAALMKADLAKFAKVIKTANIKIEN